MRTSKVCLSFILIAAIAALFAGCGSKEKAPSESSAPNPPAQEAAAQNRKDPGVVTGARETVLDMYRAASTGNQETFLKIAEGYVNSTAESPSETMGNLAELFEVKGGAEGITLEEATKEQLAPFYLARIEEQFGPYGEKAVVVIEWSLSHDTEPMAWVVERRDKENRVIRRDLDLEEGSKFTFFERETGQTAQQPGKTANSGGSQGQVSLTDVMRGSPYNTIVALYEAALNGDKDVFENITQFSTEKIHSSWMAERVMEAGSTEGLRIEEIDKAWIKADLRDKMAKEYGKDFALMVEWEKDDYAQLFILKKVNGSYYVMWHEDENKDGFLDYYVNEKYEYDMSIFDEENVDYE